MPGNLLLYLFHHPGKIKNPLQHFLPRSIENADQFPLSLEEQEVAPADHEPGLGQRLFQSL